MKQMAFFLARVSGSQGRVSKYAAVMPTRSSRTRNFVLMAAIIVPARADGGAGLTIHGASLRK